MTNTTRLGLWALALGILLGVLGEALRAPAGGIGANFAVWVSALVLATLGLLAAFPDLRKGVRLPLLPVAVLFALMFAWRDSPTLRAVHAMLVLFLLGLSVKGYLNRRLRESGFVDGILESLRTMAGTIIGPVTLVDSGITWSEVPRRNSPVVAGVLRGLLIALPLLLVFGLLLASADQIFKSRIDWILDWDIEAVVRHFIYIAVFAYIGMGYLRAATAPRTSVFGPAAPGSPGKAPVESAVVLALLDLLFLAFVAIQVQYLFGGEAHLEQTAGLTYASYARQGFFELVWVAALALPVLLLAHTYMAGAGRSRVYDALAGLMVLLLFVIMASAVKRMSLYVSTYGLTELRLYTTVFMGWLALVFAWFLATVLTGRRKWLATGALVAGLAVILATTIANPDAMIVRVNASRPDAPKRFDVDYAVGLSADAVPALLEVMPVLPSHRQAYLARELLAGPQFWSRDWRAGNLSEWRARDAIERERSRLQEITRPPLDTEPRRVPGR